MRSHLIDKLREVVVVIFVDFLFNILPLACWKYSRPAGFCHYIPNYAIMSCLCNFWSPAQCGGELSDSVNITNVTPSHWGSSLTEEKSHKGDRAVCSLSRASVTSNSDKDCSVKTIVSFCKKSGCLWNCSFNIAYGTLCTANSLIQYSVQINRHDTRCVFEMLFVINLWSGFQYVCGFSSQWVGQGWV